MTQVAGTTDSYDLIGIAEDVEDAIFSISPEETPFLTMCKRKKATNTLHQWQVDSLAAATSNKQVEGDDASFSTATSTTMLTNYTQISRKTVIMSRTADSVRKYGRAKELARLVTKYGKELKRDMEFTLVTNQASSVGGSQTARQSAGLEAIVGGGWGSAVGNRIIPTTTNTTGTTPGYTSSAWSAPTDGTTTGSTLTEAMVVAGIEMAWQDGGDPSVLMMNSSQKKLFAGFSGATKYAGAYTQQSGNVQSALIGGISLYVSDFGSHKLVLNRYMRAKTVFGLDPDYCSVAFLDGIKIEDLAKTGDAEKKMIITEYCLVVDNPDAHFKIQDLSTSAT
jgi:hypothetical protein